MQFSIIFVTWIHKSLDNELMMNTIFFISSVVIETFIWGNLDGCIQHIRCLSTVGVTWGRKQYYKKWEKNKSSGANSSFFDYIFQNFEVQLKYKTHRSPGFIYFFTRIKKFLVITASINFVSTICATNPSQCQSIYNVSLSIQYLHGFDVGLSLTPVWRWNTPDPEICQYGIKVLFLLH